jgi:hypothetical protein
VPCFFSSPPLPTSSPARGRRTPPPMKAAAATQIQAGDARGQSTSLDLHLGRRTPTCRTGGTRSTTLLVAAADHWGSLPASAGEERCEKRARMVREKEIHGRGEKSACDGKNVCPR